MPCWFYDKNALFSTPSIQDGIDHETECQYRKEGAQLIIQIGSQMELGYNTLATGIVYFHRFYMFHSFRTFSPYITACCCLFLAGKAEETPKKSKDIIKIAKTFLSEDKLLLLGEDPREEVMTMEKILLQTMKFDLKVRHPYCFLLKYAKCLKGDKRKKQKMVQMAWTFINDSLCTTLSIQWEPEIIAIAVMYLAGKLVRFKVNGWINRKPSQTHWWEIFVEDLSLQVVEDICHQVLDLYTPLSRYQADKSPRPVKNEPENSVNSQSDFSVVNTDNKVAVRDPRLENGTSLVITNPAISLKDPRLESGSVFIKCHFDMNTSNTPYMMLTSSPATPTVPQSMDQLLHNNSHLFTHSNTSMIAEGELRENSRLPILMGKFSASTVSSTMDPLANGGLSILKKGFNNVDDSQSTENRGFGFNSNNNNDYTDNRLTRRRGFGCMNDNNKDYSENRPMRNRGFSKYSRNHHFGFSHNRFRKRSFENNNHGDGDDHIENRPVGTRGFGNANNNNDRYDENKPISNRDFDKANNNNNRCDVNKPMGIRGFGNANNDNSDCTENNPMGTRGFGNINCNSDRSYNEKRSTGKRSFRNSNDNNGRYNENKPLMNRGFGSAGNYSNSCNDNDSRPKMRFNRGSRFQRPDPYPSRFNNNYENDRYSRKGGNRDASNDSTKDAPGKIVDKQHYNPSNENVKDEEEESWD